MSETACIACSMTGFYITPEGTCEEECGDGIKVNHACDDGNTLDDDGCDSTCNIELKYICEGGSLTSPDMCTRIVTLSIKKVLISADLVMTVQLNEVV